jgi:ferredoxin-NADP reductase
VIEHSPTVREYRLLPEKQRRYEAGCFLQLALAQVTSSEVWPDSRTFSIASYGKDSMTLVIQKVGSFTTRIFDELRVGSRCTVKYPFGDLFDRRNANGRHVFIAGGLGVTPFLGLLDYFRESGGLDRVEMLFSVKRTEDLFFADRIRADLGDRARFFITREKVTGFADHRIRLEDIVSDVKDFKDVHYYVCGSKDFNAQLGAALRAADCGYVHMDEWE